MSKDSTKQPIDPEIVKPDDAAADEVIHVPKGTSKARFLMTFLLVIMVLTTFSVSGSVMEFFSPRGRAMSSYLTWTSPSGVQHKLSNSDFYGELRAVAPFLDMVFRSAGQQDSRDQNETHMAAFLALEDAARESGIVITDAELAKFITEAYGANYPLVLKRYNRTPKEFEGPLRRVLAVQRYQGMISMPLSVADPKVVETKWKGRHQEYMFDYVELPVASVTADARAQAPQGDALKAWFDARSEAEKAAYKTKPEVTAELAYLSLEATPTADALFAKYPKPEGVDAEKEARDYHEGFGYVRFPATPTPGSAINSQPFDSVRDRALGEAPVYAALMRWVADLQKREAAGEAIDLAKEAAAIGLSYRLQSDSRTYDGWKDLGLGFVGRVTLMRLFPNDEKEFTDAIGKWMAAIQVDEKAFVFGRVLSAKPGGVPEFSTIADRVTAAWADAKARELAVEKLEKLRDSFGTRPDPNDPNAPLFTPTADEAKFREVVTAAGLEVRRRDWMERSAPVPPDELPAYTYLRTAPQLYTQKENTVVPAGLNREGTSAFLVRVGGLRDADVSKMKPEELVQLSREASFMDALMFRSAECSSREYLERQFKLDLLSWHPDQLEKKN